MTTKEAKRLVPGNLVTVNNPRYHPKLKGIIMMVVSNNLGQDSQRVIGLEHINQKPNTYYESYSQYDEFIDSISLTEEILIKAGLKNGGYENLFWSKKCKNGKFEINAMFYTDNSCAVGVRINDEIDVNIEFVHQLQNFYFALTGEELQINL